MKENLIIADKKYHELFEGINAKVLDSIEYISSVPQSKNTLANIYNLGNLSAYQTADYYVCLLGHARGHRVFPNISVIQDLKYKGFHSFYTDELNFLVQNKLTRIQSDTFELSCYFGVNLAKSYNDLCSHFYKVIQAPLFRIFFEKIGSEWQVSKIKLLSLSELSENHLKFATERAKEYFSSSHRYRQHHSKTLFDIAIWVDPHEEHPPSNEKAIQKFIKAGRNMNLNVEVITKKDAPYLLEYDGLFIRETTRLNHTTYRIARKAEIEGLVVIDDPTSIIRCTNKIFLEELLNQQKINRPQSFILHKKNYKQFDDSFFFPRILKKPDSAFSQGVFKVNNLDEYLITCQELFKQSDLILMQEYMLTDYDWRIGILNRKPIYACKYYMANNHWQIIDNNKTSENEGAHECIPINNIPPSILEAALKSCNAIGSGLYGVDLKEIDNKPYLIEVNDNPSLESGVEDGLLGDKLYEDIMKYFLNKCLEKRGIYGTP